MAIQPRTEPEAQALLAGWGRVYIATDSAIYESSDDATNVEPISVLN